MIEFFIRFEFITSPYEKLTINASNERASASIMISVYVIIVSEVLFINYII